MENRKESDYRAYVALWISVGMLGLNWPFMKQGLSYISPFWMLSLRFCLSAPVVAVLLMVQKHRLPVFCRGDLRVICGVALMQFVVQTGLVTVSLQWVPASTATILIYTTPLWLVVLDVFVFRHRVDRHRLLVTGISVLGCVIILLGSSGGGPLGPLFFILLASVFWSMSMRLIATHVWVGDIRDAVFWQFLIAGVVTLPLAWLIEGPPASSVFTFPGVAYLLFIGPAATGLGFGLMVSAGRSLPVARVSLISTAAPLIGFLSSAIWLKEPIHTPVLIGGATIFAALIIGSINIGKRI
ncbi:DMT family transporter [Sulfitobacter sp.]|uniref:DMT family transporter n=1 Tax=Sulfitobacter sp. TaxID=1903071 RepID=UPI003003983C